MTVPSPGVGVAVAAHGKRITESAADLCGLQSFALVGGVGGVAHARRNRVSVVGGVVAELTMTVPSPGVGVAVAAQGQGMFLSGADL